MLSLVVDFRRIIILAGIFIGLTDAAIARDFSYSLVGEIRSPDQRAVNIIDGASVNESQTIAGSYILISNNPNIASNEIHGFIYQDGNLRYPIDCLGCVDTVFTDINGSNVAVGYAKKRVGNDLGSIGFVYDSDGFEVFSYPESRNTYFTGINSKGVVSGYAQLPGGITIPFTYKAGIAKPIKAQQKGIDTVFSINNNNVIAGDIVNGRYPFTVGINSKNPKIFTQVDKFYSNMEINDRKDLVVGVFGYDIFLRNGKVSLIAPPGEVNSEVGGINNKSNMALYSSDRNAIGSRSYFYDFKKKEFSLLSVPGAAYSRAMDLTSKSIVIGAYPTDPLLGFTNGLFIAYPQ